MARTRARRITMVAALAAMAGLWLPPVVFPASAQEAGTQQSAPVGITLEKERQSLRSALRVDLTRDFATLPLYKGSADGQTVWFVITDVSDASLARELGLNHAPKLRNAGRDCPACAQEVRSDDLVLGRAPVTFQGAPDFAPLRTLTPGPTSFPPAAFTVGATAGAGYSPYVSVVGRPDVVYNAPIVATGDGPFDVTTHTNTHDRTLGIDTVARTTDHLFVRGFANGRSILYLSFDSSDAFTATVERSTFVPALVDLPFANGGGKADSARASIFTFVNAKTGLETDPPARGASQGPGRSQGLTHALSLPIVGRDAAVANEDVLDALRRGADVSNIFDVFPTNALASDREEYSPAWDLQVGVYSDAAVARGRNGLVTDANQVRNLARELVLTSPGQLPLGSANIVINCPALAFLDELPTGPRVVEPRLTLTAVRNNPRDYTFHGLAVTRPGHLLELYRVEQDGRQVLTAQTRSSATGTWSTNRRFTGSGRFGFFVRAVPDAVTVQTASRVRPTLIF